MATLPCRNDALVLLLNRQGYQPIVLPRSNILPPDIYVYEDDRLKRWGRLAQAVPAGSLPKVLGHGGLPGFDHKATSEKGAHGAASFLASALACIGVGGSPKVDLSIASGEEVSFSFQGTSYRAIDAGEVAAALEQGFDPKGIPPEQLRLGMVHVAYDYAYAASLLMRIGSKDTASAKLTAAEIDGIVSIGAGAKVELVEGTTIKYSSNSDPVAFACKVGQVKPRRGGGWTFYNKEVPGLGATADEGADRFYMMRKGAVLIVEDTPHDPA